MRVGTLIPHFGEFASRESIVRLSAKAEELGFDSLWVRDHLIWQPHGIDGTDRTFVEPFATLSAAAAVTGSVELGTAVTIPLRSPLKLAQDYAALSFIADGRTAAGIGLGANPVEFASAGYRAEDREEIFEETVAIMRQAWEGPVAHHGAHFDIEEVEIWPRPRSPIPILYGGTTPAGVRRAVRFADGWYCGRLPLATLDKRLELLRDMPEARGREMRTIVQPLVVVHRSRDKAHSHIPVQAVAQSSEGVKFWVKPASGDFSTLEDLRGLVVSGTPSDVVEQLAEFADRGITDVVVDLRLQFGQYEEALEMIGTEVLPALRSAQRGPRG